MLPPPQIQQMMSRDVREGLRGQRFISRRVTKPDERHVVRKVKEHPGWPMWVKLRGKTEDARHAERGELAGKLADE